MSLAKQTCAKMTAEVCRRHSMSTPAFTIMGEAGFRYAKEACDIEVWLLTLWHSQALKVVGNSVVPISILVGVTAQRGAGRKSMLNSQV